MKKVVVMSDSHGYHKMIDEVEYKEPDGDYYIHCGDSEVDDDRLDGWIVVRGNNDWMASYNDVEILEVEDVRIMVAHGHRFGYFERERHMVETLKDNDCQILLSGHTHVPQYEEIDDCLLINPGSTTLPRRGSPQSYCVLYIDGKDVKCEFKEI